MIATTVIVKVKPDRVDDFIQACIANHEASIQEPGNMRFDILQHEEDSSSFILYEAYASKEYAAAHKDTVHYKAWRSEVASMMAEPRQGIPYKAIRP